MSSPDLTIAEGMKVKKYNKTKNRGGVCFKGKGWIVGGGYKGGKNQ